MNGNRARASIKSNKRGRGASSKWSKTVALKKNRSVSRYIPQTQRYGGPVLKTMLRRYKMVYVKPVRGAQGVGVMRAAQNGVLYSLHSGLKLTQHLNWSRFDHLVRKRIANRSYIVQRGIHLLRYKGRIFDLRIMTQLDRNRSWQVTGMLARAASPGRAVTNGSQGATIHTIKSALGAHCNTASRLRTEAKLHKICLDSARQLRSVYPHLNELGFDIALDKKLRPWILEVNTAPDAIPFRRLADLTMYRRILRYRKQNN
ncbi:MAG: YheC/YheD family protein [Candidatus Pristimantibacillus sp.]